MGKDRSKLEPHTPLWVLPRASRTTLTQRPPAPPAAQPHSRCTQCCPRVSSAFCACAQEAALCLPTPLLSWKHCIIGWKDAVLLSVVACWDVNTDLQLHQGTQSPFIAPLAWQGVESVTAVAFEAPLPEPLWLSAPPALGPNQQFPVSLLLPHQGPVTSRLWSSSLSSFCSVGQKSPSVCPVQRHMSHFH